MPDTDYSTYLHIDSLLQLQQPLTPGAHDELLFIVVHQVYELWFRLLIDELESARDGLLDNAPAVALTRLQRVVVIGELMLGQLRLLETMSPEGFLQFRDPLTPASGFQSTQFREIEYICGVGDAQHADSEHLSDVQRERLRSRLREPTVWQALCRCLVSRGLEMPDGDDDTATALRMASLAGVYHDHAAAEWALVHQVLERLVDVDETISRWRFHHTLMAAREIGSRPGTGGSSGVSYLESTIGRRCFPDLWAVRTAL